MSATRPGLVLFDDKPATVRDELDGRPPSDGRAGADLKVDARGSFLEVSEKPALRTGRAIMTFTSSDR